MADIKYTLRKDGDGERPSVMWGWGDRLIPEEIVYQIEQFKKGGINEFFIHSGWTMEDEVYMSEQFMDKIQLASETAEKLGMHYSVYDECAWSSGVCGGQLIEQYPEYRMRIMRWFKQAVVSGGPAEIWYRGEVLGVQVQYADKARQREDITDKVKIEVFGNNEGGRVIWTNDNCCSAIMWVFCKDYMDGLAAACQWRSDATFVKGFTDTLNPAAVRKFFEMNNEKYKARPGDKFGTHIRRLFTDETPLGARGDNTMRPFSAVMEEEFFKDHGYSVRDNLIALTEEYDTDEDLKVRYDYHKTLTRLFLESYLGQYSDWCHENNLLLTGHLSGKETLYHHSVHMGDFYEALAKFDIPGMDSILSKMVVDKDYYGIEARMVASVAKFSGKDKTMCETFSGSGWDLTLEDSKRVINKLMAKGITYIIYMTAAYSFNEGRKILPMVYPPSHGYNNPLFKHYPALTDYVAIRSSLVTQTKPRGTALILLPHVEGWVHLFQGGGGKLNNGWRKCVIALQKHSIEYDMFFETLAKETEVKNGKLIVKGYEYDSIIVPYTRVSDQATLDMLEEFAKQGGRIVFAEKFPTVAADTSKKYDFTKICGLSEEGKNFFETDLQTYGVREEGNVQLIRFGEEGLFPKEQFWSDLSSFVKAGSAEEIIECDDLPIDVILSRREAEGLYCALVCNDSDETRTVTLRINSNDKITMLDGMKLKNVTAENGTLTLTIPAHEMPILMLTKEGVEIDGLEMAEEEPVVNGESKVIPLDNEWTFTTEKYNVLPLKLKYLANRTPCRTLEEELQKMAETADVPYATYEFPPKLGLEFGGGYAAYARFEVEEVPSYTELFNEVVDDGEIWVNGNLVSGFWKVHEVGPKDSVAEITPYIKKGTNVVIVISRLPKWRGPHGMPSVMVRGNFCVDGNDIVALTDKIKPSIYTAQGWRYYSGDSTYRTTFTLDTADFAKVTVEVPIKEVVEVIVNGVSAGTYYWKPYLADITKLCKQGENIIEFKVSSTYEPTMVLEEAVLLAQSFSEYLGEAKIKNAGITGEPTLTVTL